MSTHHESNRLPDWSIDIANTYKRGFKRQNLVMWAAISLNAVLTIMALVFVLSEHASNPAAAAEAMSVLGYVPLMWLTAPLWIPVFDAIGYGLVHYTPLRQYTEVAE